MSTQKMWYGWLKKESGETGFRTVNGDNGKAHGKYQFDYRYGLVPFMKFCVEENPDHYSGFNEFINMGAGNAELVNNDKFTKLWTSYCDKYPEEFEGLQDSHTYKEYYLLIKKYIKTNTGIDLDTRHAVVKGSAFSMAIRSGPSGGSKKFKNCKTTMSDEEILLKAYSTYGNSDSGRWTENGQLGDALNDLKNDVYTLITEDGRKVKTETETEVAVDAPSTSVDTSWLSIVKEVKKQYAEKGGRYDQGGYVDVTINGKTKSCRLDCSGYVWACLYFYGVTDQINLTCNARWMGQDADAMKNTGFVWKGWQGSMDKLQPGDILAGPDIPTEHTEIYAGNDMVYNVGSNKTAANPSTSPASFNHYAIVWSPSSDSSEESVTNNEKEVTNSVTETVKELSTSVVKSYYRVGTLWKDNKCVNQHGAFTSLENAITDAKAISKELNKTYYVFDNDGKIVYVESIKTSLYRVGTSWENGKCINQVGAFASLENASSFAEGNKNTYNKTYYVFDNDGNAVYEATYIDRADTFYRVGTSWKNGKCVNQIGAFKDSRNAISLADEYTKKSNTIFYVFNVAGKVLYTGKK